MNRLLPSVLLPLALLTSACGGDDDSKDAAKSGADPGAATEGSGGAGECSTSLTATYPDGQDVQLDTSAAAVSLGDGAGLTFYVGDYEVPTDSITTATMVPPDGAHLATVFVTTFNPTETPGPIAAGTTVEPTDEMGVLTFSAILYDGAESFGTAVEATGELSVVSVSDDLVCVDVEYRDGEKAVSGQIAARVHDAGF